MVILSIPQAPPTTPTLPCSWPGPTAWHESQTLGKHPRQTRTPPETWWPESDLCTSHSWCRTEAGGCRFDAPVPTDPAECRTCTPVGYARTVKSISLLLMYLLSIYLFIKCVQNQSHTHLSECLQSEIFRLRCNFLMLSTAAPQCA